MIKYFFLIALMALSPTFSLAQEVRVLSVIDGDTLRVVDSEEQAIKIRLYGVDCPELGQHSGTRAKEFAKNILQNKRIIVQSQGKDRYGRTVAIVILEDGRSLQERLLRAGLAWHYGQYCRQLRHCSRWKILEYYARQQKLGLWSEERPVPPWKWRHNIKGQRGK